MGSEIKTTGSITNRVNAIFSSVAGSHSSESDNLKSKRSVSDTSFDMLPLLDPKRSNIYTTSSPIMNEVQLSTEQHMVKMVESMLGGLHKRFDQQSETLSRNHNDLMMRINELEEAASSRDLHIDDISDQLRQSEGRAVELGSRVTELETRSRDTVGWVPTDTANTKVVILGDSNSSEKIKFVSTRGTLGSALPGETLWCPDFNNMPTAASLQSAAYTDVVIATGTNELDKEGSDPTHIAKQMYQQVCEYSAALPNAKVYMLGVLPSSDLNLNSKIKIYNQHLDDMANHMTNASFADMKVFGDSNGKLQTKFGRDRLHLNDDGLKLYASRIKTALRDRNHLPTRHRTNFTPRRQAARDSSNNYNRDGGGNSRGRGGRDRGGRGNLRGNHGAGGEINDRDNTRPR